MKERIQHLADFEVQEKLSHVFPLLVESWKDAFDQHLRELDHPNLSKITRAGIIQNLAVGNVKRLIGGTEMRVVQSGNKSYLIVPGCAIFAFKKLDENLRPRNNLTKTARDFYRHESLPHLDDLPRLISGVSITKEWTEIIGVYVVSPSSYCSNNWELDITKHDQNAQLGNQMQFEIPSDENDTSGFRPKRKSNDDETGSVQGSLF